MPESAPRNLQQFQNAIAGMPAAFQVMQVLVVPVVIWLCETSSQH